MKTLDEYIEEKKKEFRENLVGLDGKLFTGELSAGHVEDFLEAIIRDTARETVETCLPNERKDDGGYTEQGLTGVYWFNKCREEILSAAKQTGIIS